MLNYDKNWRVVFGTRTLDSNRYIQKGFVGVGSEIKYDASYLETDSTTEPNNAIVITELDFDMRSTRSAKTGNRGEDTTISLMNVSDSTINEISGEGVCVLVFAGYGGEEHLVYTGDVIWTDTTRSSPGTTTEVKCKEAYLSIKNTRVSLTYDKDISVKGIVLDLISRLEGVSIGKLSIDYLDFVYYTNGKSFFGKLERIVKDLSDTWGFDFNITNGAFNASKKGTTVGDSEYELMEQTATIITPDLVKSVTPMIDTNNRLTGNSENKSGVKLKTFLTEVDIGSFIKVVDLDNFSGVYRIESLSTYLQSRGKLWDIELELTRV